MAQGLYINGIPVRVRKDTWVRAPDKYQGSQMRLSENNIFDGRYAFAKVWDCEAYFLVLADEDQIRAAAPPGVTVEIAGELPGGSYNCIVEIGQTRLLKKLQNGVQFLHRVMSVHIEEALDDF